MKTFIFLGGCYFMAIGAAKLVYAAILWAKERK